MIVLSLVAPVAMATEISLANDIAILYTNDIRAYIDNILSYDVIAVRKMKLHSRYKQVLSVDAVNLPLCARYPGFTMDYSTVNGSGNIKVKAAEEVDNEKIVIGGLKNNLWFTKYGNVYMDCKAEDFLGEMGFAYGEPVTVIFLNQELVLPVVPTYSYVDSGRLATIAHMNDVGAHTGYLSLAINMGSFGGTYGLALKKNGDNEWWWEAAEGVSFPVEVSFELEKKGGYSAQYLLHELSCTNNREDYADLSNEEFANFRVIDTTGMAKTN